MSLIPHIGCPTPDLSTIGVLCPSCGQCLNTAEDATHDCGLNSRWAISQPGKTLPLAAGTLVAGRYRIVTLVGAGGMGEVYRAEDLRLQQPVALKFFCQRRQRDPAAAACFHREVRLARQVAHPNVCRVFDLSEEQGRAFLIMEYVGGEDLGCLFRRIGRLPLDKALAVAHQLCAGLAAAHAVGVLHRDLKPANVMLDPQGQVRITDFGLGIRDGEAVSLPASSGTPAYMAPEQLLGGRASPQTDIFALGLILHELFTGKPASAGSAGAELVRNPEGIIKTRQHWVGLDPRIQQVILRCLATEPAQRPASAEEVRAVLTSLMERRTLGVSSIEAERFATFLGRLAWTLLFATLAGMALLLMLGPPATGLGLAFSRNLTDAMSSATFIWLWCIALQAFLALLAMAFVLRGASKTPSEER